MDFNSQKKQKINEESLDDDTKNNPYVTDSCSPIWCIKTNHDPCIEVWIKEKELENLQLYFILGGKNFIENHTHIFTIDCTICPNPKPWKVLFEHMKNPMLCKIDLSCLLEQSMLYDYICTDTQNPLCLKWNETINNRWDNIKLEDLSIPEMKSIIRYAKQTNRKLDMLTNLDHTSITLNSYLECGKILDQLCMDNITLETDKKCEQKEDEMWLDYWDLYVKFSKSIVSLPTRQHHASSTIKINYSNIKHSLEKYCPDWNFIETEMIGGDLIWGGSSLVSMILGESLKLPSDIDLWVFNKEKLSKIIEYFAQKYKGWVYFVCLQSVVTILIDKSCPFGSSFPIQLVYAGENKSPFQVIHDFDMDYVRCFCDGYTIHLFPECYLAQKTRIVRYTKPIIREGRVQKTIRKGFTFQTSYEESTYGGSEYDYFYPDTRIFSQEYCLNLLKKVHPHAQITTDVSKNMLDKIRDFHSKYAQTTVPIEQFPKLLDRLQLKGKLKTFYNPLYVPGADYPRNSNIYLKYHKVNMEVTLDIQNARSLYNHDINHRMYPAHGEKFVPIDLSKEFFHLGLCDVSDQLLNGLKMLESKIAVLVSELNPLNIKSEDVVNIYKFMSRPTLRLGVCGSYETYPKTIKMKPNKNTRFINGLTGKELTYEEFMKINIKNYRINIKSSFDTILFYIRSWKLVWNISELVFYPPQFDNYPKKYWIGIVGCDQ